MQARRGREGRMADSRTRALAVRNCGRLIRGIGENHCPGRAEESGHGRATNSRSPQSSGDIRMDTEQTNAALPIGKMVISSHLAVTKHFLFHSSVLLSNESQAAAAVSRQTPHSAGAGLGAGARASLPGCVAEGEPESHQPLQGDHAVADGSTAHLVCALTEGRAVPGATLPQGISTPQKNPLVLGLDLTSSRIPNPTARTSPSTSFLSPMSHPQTDKPNLPEGHRAPRAPQQKSPVPPAISN